MGELIKRDDVLECIDDAQDGSKKTYDILADVFNRVLALPSAEAEPTVVRCKTMIPYGDFREWAKRIREDNSNVIVIPFDAEVVSADAVPQLKQTDTLIIADALRYLANDEERHELDRARAEALREQILTYGASLSAEAVQGWRTDKPTESGKYMATLDAWGRRYIDIMYYSKPMLPSRKVKGMCWYMADNEWGDVVYDDEDILAWMPLPEPYKGGEDE